MTMVSASILMFIPGPASHQRRRRGLQDLLQREADPVGLGRQQSQHAQRQEHGDDRLHPESVNDMTRETLICTIV